MAALRAAPRRSRRGAQAAMAPLGRQERQEPERDQARDRRGVNDMERAPRRGPGRRLTERGAQRRTPIIDARAAAASRRRAGAAPARIPRGLGCPRPGQPQAQLRARPTAGPRLDQRRPPGSLLKLKLNLHSGSGPAPGRVQEADAARPAQELARRAGEPVAADRAHVHRQLAHALRARRAPLTRWRWRGAAHAQTRPMLPITASPVHAPGSRAPREPDMLAPPRL